MVQNVIHCIANLVMLVLFKSVMSVSPTKFCFGAGGDKFILKLGQYRVKSVLTKWRNEGGIDLLDIENYCKDTIIKTLTC